MYNMGKFIMQAFLSMLIVNVVLGLLFCLAIGTLVPFIPFMEFGFLVSVIYCVSIAFLSKA